MSLVVAGIGCASVPPRSAAVPLDVAQVTALSRAWLAALDRMDRRAVAARLAPGFTKFQEGRFSSSAILLAVLAGRAAHGERPRRRSWVQARVVLRGAAAVFIGESRRRVPAFGGRPAVQLDAWDTLIWTRTGGAWKLACWQQARGGLAAERARWDSIYAAPWEFDAAPNQLLAETVRGLAPGDALDLASGQGRNALYLAAQGWRVTGVDISEVGLRIAREAAARRHLHLTTVDADMHTYDFGTARWDLVTLIYAGDSAQVIEKIKRALKPGGWVVVEFFHRDATAGTGMGGFATGQLSRMFGPGFQVLRDQVVEAKADWGQRRTKLVRFVARKKAHGLAPAGSRDARELGRGARAGAPVSIRLASAAGEGSTVDRAQWPSGARAPATIPGTSCSRRGRRCG